MCMRIHIERDMRQRNSEFLVAMEGKRPHQQRVNLESESLTVYRFFLVLFFQKKYKTDPHLSPFRSLEDKVENLVSNYSASYPNKNLSFTITTILPRVSTVASCFSKSSGVLFNHSPLASTTRVFFTPSLHSLPLFLQSFPQSSGAWRFNRFVPIEIPKMPSLTVEASFSSSRYIDWRVENSGSQRAKSPKSPR